MHFFSYKNNRLHAEGVPVEKIAREVGTPVYIYSYSALRSQVELFQKSFSKIPHILCYSMKCNSNLAILKAISNLGGGVDIVSEGELYRALQAGIDPQKIVFAGVGKTDSEIESALQAGILSFNVESEEELRQIQLIAKRKNKKAPVSLRVNPNIDPKTHPYITTGLKKSKFGIDGKRALELYSNAKKFSHLDMVGIDCHIGSQLTQVRPFVDTVKKVRELVLRILQMGVKLRYLDLGGGLGIQYKNEAPPTPQTYAEAILKGLEGLELTLILEPGRVLMGNSGVLITQALYLKKSPAKEFVIVDAAMNDLIRPALYESYHEIQPVAKRNRPLKKVNIVGPICESGDFFAQDRKIPEVQKGELLCIFSAGAYGFSMASNYNSRPRVAEVLVHEKKFDVIRKRESFEDLIRGESIPEFLKK